MTTIDTFNICSNCITNLFDNIENWISIIEKTLILINNDNYINFNYEKILLINKILNENKELKLEINKLNNEINKLNNENKELKLNNKKLEIYKLNNKELIYKIIEVIQDINYIDNLEKIFEYTINDNLNIRNKNRNYININDNNDTKNLKKNKLLNILLNLSIDNKDYINCLCQDEKNTFIDIIIEYLKKSNLNYNENNISKLQLKYIDMWRWY